MAHRPRDLPQWIAGVALSMIARALLARLLDDLARRRW
jgi:hypothetical protein